MSRTALLALIALVLVPASAGAATTRPPVALSATPARISLAGTGRAAIRVTNPGREAVVVDATRAGFGLDLRGRPRVVSGTSRRAATAWLSVRPTRFVLAARASATVAVSARVPRRVEPGDHDALVLLTTRPSARRPGLAVRMRLGVVVVVPRAGPGCAEPETRGPAGAPGGRRTAPRAVGRERRQRDRDAVAGPRPAPRRAPRWLGADPRRPRGSSDRARAGSSRRSIAGRCAGRARVQAELVDPVGRILRRTFRIRL
jgi:hypothetical protein